MDHSTSSTRRVGGGALGAGRNDLFIAPLVSRPMEVHMARHITRARLTRSVVGAFSAMVVCTTAAFLVAHHLARF
jgi:hypothetical protein